MTEIEIVSTTNSTVSGAVPVSDGAGGYNWQDSTPGVGGVTSFNSRTGAITPTTGDYTVSQVTGAAPLAGPTFTAVPSGPTASPGTNTTQFSTTAFVSAAITAVSGTLTTAINAVSGTLSTEITALSGGVGTLTSRTITSATTIVATDDIILADASGGAITQPLPSTFAGLLTVEAITAGTNLVQLTPAGADTIEGANFVNLGTQASGAPYQSVQMARVGTTWRII